MQPSKISVIMPTYNHAAFVTAAVESVLSQQGVDFELLIADDGSADGTRDVVAAIRDQRIRFFPNSVNRGACVVINELISRACGEYIALINSDDYWLGSDKLACQLDLLRANPAVGACFGRARFVDKDGATIGKATLPNSYGYVFEQDNRSQGNWLRHFFDLGNCLCHPTILIRKSCYAELGGYDNRLRQLPDFAMWIRLVKRFPILVCDRELIAFRQLPGENASSDTGTNLRRIVNEFFFILREFFDGMPRAVLQEGFGDLLVDRELPDERHVDIEKALLYLGGERWAAHVYRLVAMEKLFALLASPEHRPLLVQRYGFDDRAFHALTAEVEAFDMENSPCPLSSVKGAALLAEVKRRVVLRLPPALRPTMNKVLALR
ncbi:MAG: glycosyltransferase [Desulfuromonadales bacterium]|nr:glycosyltransferase [Desulfuromonadales bacterium]